MDDFLTLHLLYVTRYDFEKTLTESGRDTSLLVCGLGPQGEGREWTASNSVTTLMRSYFIIDFTADTKHMVLVAHINGS